MVKKSLRASVTRVAFGDIRTQQHWREISTDAGNIAFGLCRTYNLIREGNESH